MMRLKPLSILLALLMLAGTPWGCSGLKKEPVSKQYYDLNPQVQVPPREKPDQGHTLLVKNFSIDAAFDSHGFTYQIGDHEYVTDYYHEFISYPARLITEKTSDILYASELFKPVLNPSRQDIAYRLSGKINRLSGDFKDRSRPRAVVEIRMILEKNMGPAFSPILNHVFMAEIPIPDTGPDSLVSGWNHALSKILIRLMDEYRRISPVS